MHIFELKQCLSINAFQKCGIWPYNQNNFTDSDYLAASTTDVPLAKNVTKTETGPLNVGILQHPPPPTLEADLPS